jgi:NAD(P)H-dependent flavin oxidoreductase YrpB (nitropropane dioxygenase family)
LGKRGCACRSGIERWRLGTLGPNAGAKTVTTDIPLTGERLRNQIKKMKSLTKNPFAVNVAIGTGELRQYAQRWVEVILEEGIPVAIVSAGSPTEYTKTLKTAGKKFCTLFQPQPRQESRAGRCGCGNLRGFEAGGPRG